MLMAMNTIPSNLLSRLVIESILWSIMVKDLICVSCFLRDKVMVTLLLWIHYSCLSLIIVWWAFINNKHKLSKLNNNFIFK
jgi:hypothetical protein